jgi:hypothetical protein
MKPNNDKTDTPNNKKRGITMTAQAKISKDPVKPEMFGFEAKDSQVITFDATFIGRNGKVSLKEEDQTIECEAGKEYCPITLVTEYVEKKTKSVKAAAVFANVKIDDRDIGGIHFIFNQ